MVSKKLEDITEDEVIEFADKHLGKYNTIGNELKVHECPYCGRKHKFYLNIKSSKFICQSGNCGEKGTIFKLMHKFGIKVNFKASLSNPVKHDTVLTLSPEDQAEFKPMTEDMYKWWENRGISKDTLNYMTVCSRKGNIVFPYLQEAEMKMIKYRDYSFDPKYGTKEMKKKLYQEKGGTAVLWGIDKLDLEKPVILNEGEPDHLSWIECGFNNSTSVPFGTGNMDWIENNMKYIKKMKCIYLCYDNDSAGREAEKKVRARLEGLIQLKKINLGTYSDVNEALVAEGKNKLIEMYEHAEEFKVAGVNCAGSIDIKTDIPEYVTFLSEVDKITGGFVFPDMTVWSAYTGCGKTTLLGQLTLKCISQGYNVCYFSGEDTPEDIQLKLALQLYGRDGVREIYYPPSGKNEMFPKPETNERIKKDLKGRLTYLYDSDIMTDKQLEEKFLKVLREKNCRVFIIDNIMQVDFLNKDAGKNESQKNFVRRLVKIANKYNIQIHLVAHNKKPEANQANVYSTSGASEIVNLAYRVIQIDRIRGDEQEKIQIDTGLTVNARIRVNKKRSRFGDESKPAYLFFNNNHMAFYDTTMSDYEQIVLSSKQEQSVFTQKDIDDIEVF